jgi:hypothetical protein
MSELTEVPTIRVMNNIRNGHWDITAVEFWLAAVKEEQYRLGRAQVLDERLTLREKYESECI